MAAKLFVLATVLAVGNAVPVWFAGNNVVPVVLRNGRSPSIAYGFGSGFSSNIGGISHSSGIGASYQSGDGVAYGRGIGGSDGAYAQGIGYANAGSGYRAQPIYNVYNPQRNYGLSYSAAQNIGGGSAVAQSLNNNQFGSAVSTAHTSGPQYQNAIATSQSVRGLGYGSAISSTNNGYGSAISSTNNGFGTAISSTQNGYGQSASSAHSSGNGYAASASENIGGFGASTAQTAQQRGNGLQQSAATSINAPGFQAAHSNAVNTGYY